MHNPKYFTPVDDETGRQSFIISDHDLTHNLEAIKEALNTNFMPLNWRRMFARTVLMIGKQTLTNSHYEQTREK